MIFFLINKEQSKPHFQCIKSLKIIVETSDKNQYSYFYILNSFLKKAKKSNEVGLRYGVWGRAPAKGGGAGWGRWYISSAYQCLHLLVYVRNLKRTTKFPHISHL